MYYIDVEYEKLIEKYLLDYKDFVYKNYWSTQDYDSVCYEYNKLVDFINNQRTCLEKRMLELHDYLQSAGFDLTGNINNTHFNFIDNILEYSESRQNEIINVSGIELNYNDLFYYPKKCLSGRTSKYFKLIDDFYLEIGTKSLIYRKHLSDIKEETERVGKASEILKLYRRLLVKADDAISELINPIFENSEDPKIPRDFYCQLIRHAFDFYEICKTVFGNLSVVNVLDEDFVFDETEKEFNAGLEKIAEEISIIEELYINDNHFHGRRYERTPIF